MVVRNIPPLVADSGSLTIMRRTSTYVYGAWQVSLPDGVNYTEQAELTSTEQAYVYRPPNRPTGRFDLGFVRQDANIYIDKIDKRGTPSGTSNVELQMDIGQRRGAGRALVEREITARGLGSLVPGVDFTTGDIVPVLIWGKIVHLPVTALDWRSGVDGNVGWSVRCGGQLIWDGEQLRSQIDEVQKQLDRERREREREEQRMKEQAERDRQQTDQISRNQSTLSSQQSQIRSWSTSVVNHSDQLAQLLKVLADVDSNGLGLLWSIRDLAVAVRDLAENTQAGRDRAHRVADSTSSLVTGDMQKIVAIGKINKLPNVPST
jgi:hypothetical protein